MSKRARFVILLLTIVAAALVLRPTIQWMMISEEDKQLLLITEDQLYEQSPEVRAKIDRMKNIRKKTLNLGLDLKGGVYISAGIDKEDLRKQLMDKYDNDEKKVEQVLDQEMKDSVDRALEVLKNRMDQFGVSSPNIRKTFGERISIELPGLKNPQLIMDALSRVGRLEFMLVDEDTMSKLREYGVPMGDQGYVTDRDKVPSEMEIPEDSIWVAYWENDENGRPRVKGWYVLKAKVEMDGSAIKNAVADTGQYDRFIVSFQLTPEGTDVFQELTGNNIGKRLAIVLDGKVKSAPNIQSEIMGSGQITGNFTFEETAFLAKILKAGSLPVKLDIDQGEIKMIGPTLGNDSIRDGAKAFLIGTAVVIIFMIIYYRGGGIIAVISLIFNLYFLMAFLALMRATLTLPGIAGIALTVGMAVDANVIIYERIREEMRRSRSFKHALENGYRAARTTIWDSNITTLIAAFALSTYGTKDIQGFGVTLAFGIISNVFAALFISRLIFDWLIDTFRLKKVSV